jgi:hypothetical protein
LFTFATAVFNDSQVALFVTFRVPPLLNVPVAVYARLVPGARVVAFGVMAIDDNWGVVTVRLAVPGVPGAFVAVIVTGRLVTATPVASPLTVIVDLVVSDDVHATVLVMSSLLLSLKVPVAVNCC